MPTVNVLITRFLDASPPGWVECELIDVRGRVHSFAEKVPIFTAAGFDAESVYPQSGAIGCQVVKEWHDAQGWEVVTIDTRLPDHVESLAGGTRFDVSPSQLIGG